MSNSFKYGKKTTGFFLASASLLGCATLSTSSSLGQVAHAASPLPAVQAGASTPFTSAVQVFQATNPVTGTTFLTTSAKEAAGASVFGYTHNDGPVFQASPTAQAGLVAVHRLYNPTYGFVFIPEGSELTKAVASYGYTDQKIAFYASKTAANGLIPVYRLSNPTKHFVFTTDKSVVDDQVKLPGWSEGFTAFYVQSSDPHQIHANGVGTEGKTSNIWVNWMDKSDQGDARNHIKYGLTSPTITQAMVGKKIIFWSEGDTDAPVDASVYGVGYFKDNKWVGVDGAVTSSQGDVAVITATITQAMVGTTLDSGGRATVLTSSPNHIIRGQIWIDGVDQGSVEQTVHEPSLAPAAPTDGVPLQAKAAGYTSQKMSTDFSSLNAVDLSHSGDLTKQWFTDRTWSNPLPAQDLSLAGGGMKISPETNDGPNYDLATMSKAGQGGEHFTYGYFQARLKFDPTIKTTPQLTDAQNVTTQVGGWPSWWLYDAEALQRGSIPQASEIDGLEYFNDASYGGLSRYTGSVWDHLNGQNTASGGNDDMLFPTNHSQSDWNTYGILWTPGKIQWDVDGLVAKTLTYGPNQRPAINGVVQSQLPVGLFSHLDLTTQGMGLLLGTGKGDPLSVSNVQVWQAK